MNTAVNKKLLPIILIAITLVSGLPLVQAGMVWKEALLAATPRTQHCMVTDYGNDRVLLLHGLTTDEGYNQDLLSWNGWQWERIESHDNCPSPRQLSQVVYNPNEDSIYLYGGYCFSSEGDCESLWRYKEGMWEEIIPQENWPEARSKHAMAYDPVLDQLLLYGGNIDEPEENITWVWQSDGWEGFVQADGPGKIKGHAMCYHEASGRIMMFGGEYPSGMMSSATWVWTGAGWTQESINYPGGRAYFNLSYDPSREVVVMTGGGSTGTYEWDGSTWTYKSAAVYPPTRYYSGLAFDPESGETILFGGERSSSQRLGDMWSWNGERWREIELPVFPHVRERNSLGYDERNHEMVLFGGMSDLYPEGEIWFNDTWAWNGSEWELLNPAHKPYARIGAKMAYHEGLERLIMFGGTTRSSITMDMWIWDGFDWEQIFPSNIPTTRTLFSLVSDSTRNVLILFGGSRYPDSLNDVWEFDGDCWVEKAPTVSPNGRYSSASGYDKRRQRTVIFGGRDYSSDHFLNDTWEWDGEMWEEKNPSENPPAQGCYEMFYDENRHRIVLYGGSSMSNFPKVWEWDGNDWSEKLSEIKYINDTLISLGYDRNRRTAVVFGGHSEVFHDDTWELSEAFSVNLIPNQLWYEPGDPFELTLVLNNAGPEESQIIFVLLEAYDSYWFWPGWLPCPPYLDFDKRIIPPGMSTEIVASFIIPDDPDFLENVSFHAALYEPETHVQTSYAEISLEPLIE